MRTTITLIALSLLLFATHPAAAHAFLDRADPRVGSSVPTAPREVALWFTQKLEPAFSNAQVFNSAGARVDQGRARVDRSDPSVMRVSVKALTPGTYKVHWRVLSVDTHTTEGSFSFRVGQ
jgi:methionine-rich copper-binding protein CopC